MDWRKMGQILAAIIVWGVVIALLNGMRGSPYQGRSIASLQGLSGLSCGTGGGVFCSYRIEPELRIQDKLAQELRITGWTETADEYIVFKKRFGSWMPDRATVRIKKDLFLDKVSIYATYGHVPLWLGLANMAMFVIHSALILFNVFGWLVPRWRGWNLATLGLTLGSWLVMGLWNGMGYCVLTDIHWRIRDAMGISESADSFLVLVTRLVSGWNPPVAFVNTVAMWFLIVSVIGSVTLNIRDWRLRSSGLARKD